MDIGAKIDELTATVAGINGTVSDAIRQAAIARERDLEQLRGIKYLDLPVIRAAGANPFTVGGDVAPSGGELVSPNQGYVWFLRALTIEGMTRGATPDIIQVRRSSAQGVCIWELNGNQYAQTWGRGEKWVRAGETLFYASVGTFISTATITISGVVEEVPAEMIGKLK